MKIADNYGDGLRVTAGSGNVYVNNLGIEGESGLKVDFSFDPAAARRLAKALKKAAAKTEVVQ